MWWLLVPIIIFIPFRVSLLLIAVMLVRILLELITSTKLVLSTIFKLHEVTTK